jgi:ABC-type uncharacterized transport system permease subunit
VNAQPGWFAQTILRPLLPIVLAVLATMVLLLSIGKNPLEFYAAVLRFGVLGTGWQNSLVMMAPLILVALGLLVAFRAGLWNLGYDGQFIIPATLVAGLGPSIVASIPLWLAIPTLMLIALLAGAAWAFVPAWLKVARGANEIVTTLAMSFIGIGVANLLIRGVFHDPGVLVPQTAVIPNWALLAYIPGTKIHVGVVFAFLLLVVVHIVLTRTSVGVRIDLLGGSPRTARAVGMQTGLVTILVFLASGALIGLAGATDMLGVWGYARTDWNPAYGMAVIPFVLIARLNALAVVPLLGIYSIFATGATIAAANAGISVDFVVIMVSLILGFMALTEWMFSSRSSATRDFWRRLFGRQSRAGEVRV